VPTYTETPAPASAPSSRIVLNQLYGAIVLMIAGAGAGIAGGKLSDTATAVAIGTALIGAGAAMLPVGAAAHASVTEALAPLLASATTTSVPSGSVAGPTSGANADLLAAEDPTFPGLDPISNGGTTADDQAAGTLGAQRQADGDDL
jgi:hypothetical protein